MRSTSTGADVNAIHMKGARVVAKRKRRRSPPQARVPFVFGRTPEAMPLVHRLLKSYQRRYERGDRTALLQALDLCLDCFHGSPNWVADATMDAIRRWLAYEAATLDEAFGVKRSGKHINSLREREALRPAIMMRVIQLHQQGEAIGSDTFAKVGKEIGRSEPYVRAIYYEAASAAWQKVLRKMRIS